MRYNSIAELVDECYKNLELNYLHGKRWGMDYHFYKPAQTKYGPHQWLWDSGWHMITWSYRNPNNSIADLRTMLQFQQPNGFIPEMIFWEKKRWFEKLAEHFFGYSQNKVINKETGKVEKGVFYTDISQMPMLGYSLRAIWNATHNKDLLKEFVPKLVHYLEWWTNERDPDKDGLVSIIHPWESGIDASPLYDPAHGIQRADHPIVWKQLYPKFIKLILKYRHKAHWNQDAILKEGWFNFEDIGLCCVYADNWNVLAKLADEFDSGLATKCREQYKIFEGKILNKSWDPEKKQFISFYHQKEKEYPSDIETIQSLFPLLLENIPKDIQEIIVEKIRDPEKFGTPYPLPSCSKSEPAFYPKHWRLLWRGPTWGSTNWFVLEGLLKHGYKAEAENILNKWVEMSMKYGISEYHDPITGTMEGEEGLGMASTFIDMAHRFGKI
jgi:hypothetical protein